MKTLDEVMNEMAFEQQYNTSEWTELNAEALHYLKEYKDDKDELDSTRFAYLDILTDYVTLKNFWAESQANPPLTWDELREMDGKPVWIELSYQMAWGLNDGTYIDAFGHEIVTIKVLHDLWHLDKALMGKVWQAFRKERG